MASVRKRKGRWYARYRGADGKKHEMLLPASVVGKAEAVRHAQDLESREWRVSQGLETAPSTELLKDAAQRYLKAIRHHRSWTSIESRWRRHILPELGQVPVAQLRPTQVDALLAGLKDKGYSQQTLRHVRTTLSAFYTWLQKDGVVRSSPLEHVDAIPVPEGDPKVLSEEEVRAVAAHASSEGLRCLVLLAYYTACRPGELLALTWADVDEGLAVLRVRRTLGSNTTKTGRSREVHLPAAARELVRQMRASRGGDEVLFRNALGGPLKLRRAERAFHVACRKAGLQGHFNLKDLRASSVTRIVERTGSLHVGAAHAGHARVETTRRHYLAVRAAFVAQQVEQAFAPLPPQPPAPAAAPSPERVVH